MFIYKQQPGGLAFLDELVIIFDALPLPRGGVVLRPLGVNIRLPEVTESIDVPVLRAPDARAVILESCFSA